MDTELFVDVQPVQTDLLSLPQIRVLLWGKQCLHSRNRFLELFELLGLVTLGSWLMSSCDTGYNIMFQFGLHKVMEHADAPWCSVCWSYWLVIAHYITSELTWSHKEAEKVIKLLISKENTLYRFTVFEPILDKMSAQSIKVEISNILFFMFLCRTPAVWLYSTSICSCCCLTPQISSPVQLLWLKRVPGMAAFERSFKVERINESL